jgi:hypothetical protein
MTLKTLRTMQIPRSIQTGNLYLKAHMLLGAALLEATDHIPPDIHLKELRKMVVHL